MKLFVQNSIDNKKIYLNDLATNRRELAHLIGSPWFYLENQKYHVNQVMAEPGANNTATGAIIGGILGLIGGPTGVLIGGVLGGALGNGTDKSEQILVDKFNNSRVQW